MNRFECYDGFLGTMDYAQVKYGTEEMFRAAHTIRVKLGRKGYYLDKYLHDLFTALGTVNVSDVASEGFDAWWDLFKLAEEIIKGEGNKEHPLNEKTKEFIAAHPLDLQERETKMDFYCVSLAGDYLKYAAGIRLEKLGKHVTAAVSSVEDLYGTISDMLGGTSAMDWLNHLVAQRFILSSAAAAFSQGMTGAVLDALTWRDTETGKTVIQIILDRLDDN